MTPDLDTEIAALQARITAATREKIRAEHSRDAAIAARDAARAQLVAEFAVGTVAEAQLLLAQMRTDLSTYLQAINRTLDGLDP